MIKDPLRTFKLYFKSFIESWRSIKEILLIRSAELYKGNKEPDLLGEDNTHGISGSVDANLIEITQS